MKLNSKAPEFTLTNSEGRSVSLSGIMAEGQHVLLVFLRHLG